MFQDLTIIKRCVRNIFAFSLLSIAAAAQTTSSIPLISLIQPLRSQAVMSTAGTSAASPLLQVVSFPATPRDSAGATQTVSLRLNTNLSIQSINIPAPANGKQEFRVLNISGCNTDGSSTSFSGTTCSVNIQFNPAYPGLRAAALKVETNEGIVSFGVTGVGVAPLAALTPGVIATAAGKAYTSSAYCSVQSGDGGPATDAVLGPFVIGNVLAFDHDGNLYFIVDAHTPDCSTYYPVVRRIDGKTGIITTVAGSAPPTIGTISGDGGPATQATFGYPQALAIDPAGNLYVADGAYLNGNQNSPFAEVRKIDISTGIISAFAGGSTTPGYSGDGGPALGAGMSGWPLDMAFDPSGNLYLAFDGGNANASDYASYPYLLAPDHRVRKIDATTGIITTVAGTGNVPPGAASGDGQAATATNIIPSRLAVDTHGNLYIGESRHYSDVRKVDAVTGIITTVAGKGTGGNSGDGGPATSALITMGYITLDPAGNIYLPGTGSIRKVDASTGIISTIEGGGPAGSIGEGVSSSSVSLGPNSVVFDSEANMYFGIFADAQDSNTIIHRISASSATLTFPTAVAAGTPDTADNPQKVVLSNVGNAPLTFTGTNPELNSQDFSLDSSTTCPPSSQTLAIGSSCVMAASFSPTAQGTLTGVITLTDNSNNIDGSQQTIALAGTGLASAVQPTTTTVTAINPAQAMIGQSVIVTASVVDSKDRTKTPTGSVTFFTGYTALGTASLVNGVATFAYTPSTAGAFVITASYATDNANQFGNSSSVTGQTLTAYSDFALYGGGKTITASQSGAFPTFQFGIQSLSGGLYPGVVTFSITGLPAGATATFSPNQLAQDAGQLMVTVTIHLAKNQGQNAPKGSKSKTAPFGVATAFLIGGIFWRRRRVLFLFLLPFTLLIATSLTGCVQGASLPSSDVGTYQLVVTANSGAVSHDVSDQLRLTN